MEAAGCTVQTFEADALCIACEGGPTCLTRPVLAADDHRRRSADPLLEAHGVDTVFGIPGVHTVELYRGLARSKIRHVTPRHEQGAGFMADGYARVSGKPGVAFVITGPGLTNTITAMAQARADSVPMLVISGVNATATLGKGLGYLHELPDQRGMMEKVALFSHRIDRGRRTARRAGARLRAVRRRRGPGRCISRSRST